MAPDHIRFASIKEDRDWYYVEYFPPLPNYRFSVLQLSVLDESRKGEEIASAMEREVRTWLSRYPIPLMTTSFTLDGSVLRLSPARPIDHLVAWLDSELNEVLHWELVADAEMPAVALDRRSLTRIFSDVPFKTGREMREAANRHAAALRMGWWLVFFWAVVVPLVVTVLEWWSDLLGIFVLVYAFFKAAAKALRLTGRLPKSEREVENEAEETKMRHYFYHCELNPEAFEQLKLENFRREAVEKTKSEAATLKEQPVSTNDG